jgi:hypothetical protein
MNYEPFLTRSNFNAEASDKNNFSLSLLKTSDKIYNFKAVASFDFSVMRYEKVFNNGKI